MAILLIDHCLESGNQITSVLARTCQQEIRRMASLAEALLVLDETSLTEVELIIYNADASYDEVMHNCDILNSFPGLERLPIILLLDNNEMAISGIHLPSGIMEYVFKPIREVELCSRVNNVLNLMREQQQRKHLEISLAQKEEQLQNISAMNHLMYFDVLTGLPNQRQFEEVLKREAKRANRDERNIALIILKIDFFPAYIQLYGYEAGQQCITRLAKVLAQQLKRPGDLLARYAEDEFALCLPDSDMLGGTVLAEILRTTVLSLHIPHENSLGGAYVSASLGVACQVAGQEPEPEALIKSAYKALSRCRTEGFNRVLTGR